MTLQQLSNRHSRPSSAWVQAEEAKGAGPKRRANKHSVVMKKPARSEVASAGVMGPRTTVLVLAGIAAATIVFWSWVVWLLIQLFSS
jgi:hypothetical protein